MVGVVVCGSRLGVIACRASGGSSCYSHSAKAALPVVQVVLFPLAFAGGLFMPPEVFPTWLNAFSEALPSRAGRDLLIQALTGEPAYDLAIPVLLGWTMAFAALAIWAYRRDEGDRFR